MTLASSSGLMFDGSLPLIVTRLLSLPPQHELAAANDANDILLQNLLLNDERHEHDDGHDEVMQELRRQDIRLRVITELLATLLQQQNLLPLPARVRLSGDELALPAADHATLQLGSWLRCELFIDTTVPKPLLLHAVVAKVVMPSSDDQPWLLCHLHGIGASVQDSIDKLVFRQHRKSVAMQRRSKGS